MSFQYSILIVDDSPEYCNALKKLIQSSDLNATVTFVYNTNAANELLFAETAEFDILILDLCLPDERGNIVYSAGATILQNVTEKYNRPIAVMVISELGSVAEIYKLLEFTKSLVAFQFMAKSTLHSSYIVELKLLAEKLDLAKSD